MTYWGFPPYVSVAEKRERAARKRKELSKKYPNLKPVILQGTKIAHTWWGKAWNLNLERYADYHNRIGRGRTYVRHGAVLDLQIDSGEARALVQGSQSKPYSVVVNIKTLKRERWQSILSQCQGLLESLRELLHGNFPRAIGEIFTHEDAGMFPSPREITFNCSCPDWAGMCKHVAATLYGIGARLDESPELFFKMRNVEVSDLVRQAVSDHKEKLLARAIKKSSRVIEKIDLSATFGIELQDIAAISPVPSGRAISAGPRARKKAESSAKGRSMKKGLSRTTCTKGTEPKATDRKTIQAKKKAAGTKRTIREGSE
jgi:uncharacterized Zn finger protein